jgi:hypothetical protein
MSTECNDRLVSIPHVPHGPQGVAQDEADADYYRKAAENIRYHKVHGHAFAGSNVTEAVAKLCEAAADALSKPRTVTTVEELDALPDGSVVLSGGVIPRIRTESGWEGDGVTVGSDHIIYWAKTAIVLHKGDAS